MKAAIHPETLRATVVCATCGTTFETRSVTGDLTIDVCSSCHPAYTGKTRTMTSGSRVERFERRYGRALRTTQSSAL